MPVTDGLLHLGPGSSGTLRIVASKGGGTVTAKVTDADDNPVPDATVVVIPERVANTQQLSAFARLGLTDSGGYFRSATLAPGKYRAVALTRLYW